MCHAVSYSTYKAKNQAVVFFISNHAFFISSSLIFFAVTTLDWKILIIIHHLNQGEIFILVCMLHIKTHIYLWPNKYVYHRFPVIMFPFYLRDNNSFRMFAGWLDSLMSVQGNWKRDRVSFWSALKMLHGGSERLSKHKWVHGCTVKHPPAMGAESLASVSCAVVFMSKRKRIGKRV